MTLIEVEPHRDGRWPVRWLAHNTFTKSARPREDHRGVDLISDALPFGRLWYGEPDAVSNAINYAKFFSRSAVHTPLLITDHCLRRRLAHFKLGARVLTQCRLVFQLCGQLFPL